MSPTDTQAEKSNPPKRPKGPLTDTKLRRLKPDAHAYRVPDAHGLNVEVTPTGSRLWRYRYRFNGKETVMALGQYPAVTLAEARERRRAARLLLDAGRNPTLERRLERRTRAVAAGNTFQAIATEWIEKQAAQWTPHHALDVQRSLTKEAFPAFGERPITEIEAPEILACLRTIESRGALEIAHRTAQRIAAVFRYAVLTGRAKYNPAADLRGALATRKVKHMTALAVDELPDYLDKLERYDGNLQTKLALRFMLLTFVRTTELLGADWDEIDTSAREWRIPAERMKMREPHTVPLSTQALAVLDELRAFTGQTPLLFPGRSNAHRPMSSNTMLFALYRMGYHSRATTHGFRALASTVLNEQGWRVDVIERQLAHGERNKVRAAYNRAQYLPERHQMMQAWADFLDTASRKHKVIPIRRAKR